MNGILVVDKPAGWTSHDVVAKLRGALKIKRVGHGGTLDPMATGVLPVFVGRATRAAEFLTGAEKEYIAGLRLGIVTDTQDITGNTLSFCEASVTMNDIAAVIPDFLGAIKQTPPMYSAVRHDGKKLYELARRGVEVTRPQRDIFISAIEILSGDMDRAHGNGRDGGNSGCSDVLLRVACSKGTYIRTLCHDIGAALGCGGALSSLRRTIAGVFDISMAHTLEAILDAISSNEAGKIMLPTDTVFSVYPAVTLSESQSRKCKNGVQCDAEYAQDGKYRFYDPDGEFLMIGEVRNGKIKMIKGFYVR